MHIGFPENGHTPPGMDIAIRISATEHQYEVLQLGLSNLQQKNGLTLVSTYSLLQFCS